MSTIPQVSFAGYNESHIKRTIWANMDCELQSNRRLGQVTRWFKDYPEFTLTAGPKFNDKSIIEIQDYHSKWFDMSIVRINRLYTHIKSLFKDGMFDSRYDRSYPITVNQIFSLGQNVWVSVDDQSVFYCEFQGLPEEYKEWSDLAISFDFTYMMSDSPGTYKAGRSYEERMKEAKEGLDNKVCTLWYNYILGRSSSRPQGMSFGMHSRESWNTKEEAYSLFHIRPTVHPVVIEGHKPENKPCIGFPPHPKKVGWVQGDYNVDPIYSNAYMWSKEEYEQSLIGEE